MELADLPQFASDKDVSAVTGIPVGTLKYFRHRGYGGPKSFALTPRAIRYRREDVIEWVEARYANSVHSGDAA